MGTNDTNGTVMTRVRRKLAVVLFSSVLACRPGEPAAVDEALITFDKYHTVEEFQDYLEAIFDRHSAISTGERSSAVKRLSISLTIC